MLYAYTVTPLKEDHFEERVADIKEMYRSGITVMPLFCMTLVPEGDPVWDKAGPMAKLFCRYRDALQKEGIPAGILVQASLGHEYEIKPNPFQKYEALTDGEERFVCCPEDERFIAHFQGVLRTLAKAKPAAIMLDDDFRMSVRPGKGCVCPLHLREFNRRAGTQFTKDELRQYVFDHPRGDPLTKLYTQTQTDSLVKAAKAFRAAIDEVDPTIQGINCTSGHFCDSVIYTNPIFAGKGNPTMVRVPNGIYAPVSVRGFSDLMRQAAICSSKLKKHGIEIILAETDTIPFNRYGKGARHLHAHYTASILEGLKGAKHWLYRSTAFEPDSGRAYRAILAKHQKMYEALAALSDEITWLGANSAFIEQEEFCYDAENFRRYHDNDWVVMNLERMGLPFYFSETYSEATFLEGDLVEDLSDQQLDALTETSLFADGESAAALIRRGYGHLLGVEVSEWEGRRSGECFDQEGLVCCTAQKNPKRLTLNGAEALSYNYVIDQGKPKLLAPAVTKFIRPNGKLSVVYCGSPTARFHYTEGFSFLNETRKKQFVSLLKEAGALPTYYVGDEEICLRAGTLKDGSLLISLYNLGYDPAEEVCLYLEKEPAEIKWMQPDGTLRSVGFQKSGESIYALGLSAEPMYPVILIIS
ncbi:MAG: hypothetical protein IJN82_06400 [Clostridia bacterium]|nr:hypothetical protein [Clostridia bacterium]